MTSATLSSLPKRKKSSASFPDEELQERVVDLFTDLARLLGTAPSLGSIYGALFIAEKPLTMNDLIDRLDISKGSASQGLRHLRELGAVRAVRPQGGRSDHYEAELELKRLLSAFVRDHMLPRLSQTSSSLEVLTQLADKVSPKFRDTAGKRLQKLETWHHKAMSALPFALKLLED